MALDELKAYARRVPEELLTQGDLAVADAVFATDVVSHDATGHMPGVAGTKQVVLTLRRAFPDLCALVEDEIAEGDRVVQRITLSGTHWGEYYGLKPTGRRATWQLVTIQRIGPDGKIAERWSNGDDLGMLQQIGVVPTPGQATEEAGA